MCGQSTFSSCGHVGGQRKAKNGQKHHRTTAQGKKSRRTKSPKDENILLLQPSRCTISHLWSCDHMIQVWTINILVMRSRWQTEKSHNGLKHHRTTAPMDKNQGGQIQQKMKILYYSNLQGVRYPISGHVITWYRCGQSTVLSCGHVGIQRKAKMDKSTIGQQSYLIKIKADKTPKRWKYFTFQPSRCKISHLWSCDHMIQVWTINILVMRSRGQTEKSHNGLKHHRTTAPMDKNQGGQSQQKMKILYYSNLQGVRYSISCHVITWYRCVQSTFLSCGHVGRQRKAKMDKSTIGQQSYLIKIKEDKTPKRWKYFTFQLSRCTISHLWSCDHMIQVWKSTFSSCGHVGG